MLELLEDIENALKAGALRSVLTLSLTIPDICGQVEYPSGDTRTRYVDWCNNYLRASAITTLFPFADKPNIISGEMCYKLRCAYLHSGNTELNQRKADQFPGFQLKITSTQDQGIYIDSFLGDTSSQHGTVVLDIRNLCHLLCFSAKKYYEKHEKEDFDNHSIQIIDALKEADDIREARRRYQEIRFLKKNPGDIDELSEEARALYDALILADDEKEAAKIINKRDDSIEGKIVICEVMEVFCSDGKIQN